MPSNGHFGSHKVNIESSNDPRGNKVGPTLMNLDDALLEARIKIGEVNRRRAEQLARSVLPVFAEDRQGQPARLSSCVLGAGEGHHFAFTAASQLKEAGEMVLVTVWGPNAEP